VTTIDVEAREAKVKQMHRSVAEQPHGNYHVELGRSIAERLGFSPGTAARNPGCESFADIGYVFGLARQYDGSRKRSGQPAMITLISRIRHHFISQRARDASTRYG
jgi:hypothetical protein